LKKKKEKVTKRNRPTGARFIQKEERETWRIRSTVGGRGGRGNKKKREPSEEKVKDWPIHGLPTEEKN